MTGQANEKMLGDIKEETEISNDNLNASEKNRLKGLAPINF